MGRKIPGRKHHGVRDPEKQRALRLQLQRVNEAPTNEDSQPIPNSLRRIGELIEKAKNGPKIQNKAIKKAKNEKKSKKLIVIKSKVGENEKTVPKFEQKKGESDKVFLNRCHKMCENVIREVNFENKFGVEVTRNSETGKIENTINKKVEDPLKKMIKDAKKEAKKKPKKKKKDEGIVKLTKAEKKKLKLKMKKEQKKEKSFPDFQRDTVKFGDVYHAPPELPLPAKVAKKNEAARPGQKNLLLKAIINGEEVPNQVKKPVQKSLNATKKVGQKNINKKGKRKDLPAGVRKQLEMQQKEIIEAYKAVKANKPKNQLRK